MSQFKRVGTEIINSVAVPVFQLPSGARFAEVYDSLSERPNLVSLTAAKQFKSGNYPVDSSFMPAQTREGPAPFSRLSEEEQMKATQHLLATLCKRVTTSAAHFNFMDN